MTRALAVGLACISTLAFAQRNPDLERAQQQLATKKYDAALKSIDAAAKKGNLDRESLLTLLESRGLAQASLGKAEEAEKSFRSVLQLEPRRDLTGKYTGPVTAVIASAKAWFKDNGGIELGPLDPGTQDGRVKQVSFFVRNDPLKLITTARIYVRADGGAWKPIETTVVNGAAAADTDAAVVEWWAEALSDRKDQLMFLGSAGKPIKQTAPAPVVAVAPRSDVPTKTEVTPAPSSNSEPIITEARTTGPSAVRVTGFVLLGVGVVAAGVGVGLGVSANAQATAIKSDLAAGTTDRSTLYQRDQARITQAALANGLMIGGGVVAVTGLIMAIAGGDAAPATTVAFVPTVGGGTVALSGSF